MYGVGLDHVQRGFDTAKENREEQIKQAIFMARESVSPHRVHALPVDLIPINRPHHALPEGPAPLSLKSPDPVHEIRHFPRLLLARRILHPARDVHAEGIRDPQGLFHVLRKQPPRHNHRVS